MLIGSDGGPCYGLYLEIPQEPQLLIGRGLGGKVNYGKGTANLLLEVWSCQKKQVTGAMIWNDLFSPQLVPSLSESRPP